MKKIISCAVFKPYLEKLGISDVLYLDISQHNVPKELLKKLQQHINEVDGKVDEIYLLYGICGNAIQGLTSNYSKLIFLRMHDCLAVFLGSNKRYFSVREQYPHHVWRCSSNMSQDYKVDEYNRFVELYGEDNAEYLMSVLHGGSSEIMYVTTDMEDDNNNIVQCETESDVVVIEGTIDFLQRYFQQKEMESVTIFPNKAVECVYDEVVMIKEKE